MGKTEQENALTGALARLEDCLETPIVPGELPSWIGDASKAIAEVGVHLRRQIETDHQQIFAQIATEDAELLRHVEDMKQEDTTLNELHQQLLDDVAKLCERAREGTPRAVIREEDMAPFVERGLSLVIRVRKQEKALSTWFVEAFNRDRGIAD